jgi:hypothetical protein
LNTWSSTQINSIQSIRLAQRFSKPEPVFAAGSRLAPSAVLARTNRHRRRLMPGKRSQVRGQGICSAIAHSRGTRHIFHAPDNYRRQRGSPERASSEPQATLEAAKVPARPLNRDERLESAAAELDAQFAAHWRTPMLETSLQNPCASRAAYIAPFAAEYFLAVAVALRAGYDVAVRDCSGACGWCWLRVLPA